MKTKTSTLLIPLFMAGLCVAQESSLTSADGDGDGTVTVKEFATYAGARLEGFDRVDAFAKKVDIDGDGEISEKEFAGRMQILQKIMASETTASNDQETKSKNDGPHKVGDKASDFELQSIGKKIKLSDNFGDDGKTTIVVFSRAHW